MKNLILLSLLISIPAWASFDAADLDILIQESKLKDSDALIVWKDGTILHSSDKDETKLYSVQSVTKSITALVASCLLRDQPEQLDSPSLFPEWKNTPKEAITLRMLLSMTSGIIDPADPWGDFDYYAHAAAQPLTTKPGEVFSYANTSPMLVGKWIKESTGKQFSTHLKQCFFDDMGIEDWTIGKDGARNEVVAGGMKIKANDLLKLGIMLAQNGTYEGKQLMTPSQVGELRKDPLADNNGYGLGFWSWGRQVFYAEGYLGQFLIMVPSEKLVIVRVRNPLGMRSTPENMTNWFTELPGLIVKLLK
jgi:CubicO group peptidase (beta-lactamase class C family)